MADIKVPGRLIPANDEFEVVSTDHVAYQRARSMPENLTSVLARLEAGSGTADKIMYEGDESLYEVVKDLKDTVYAVPRLYIKESDLTKQVDINEDISIEVILQTTSIGKCNFRYSFKPINSTSWQSVSKAEDAGGPFNFSLGRIKSMGSYTYKLTATDGQNKTCDLYSYTDANNLEGTATKLDSIEIEVVAGLITFNSNFNDIVSTTIYKKDQEQELTYNCESCYAKQCVAQTLEVVITDPDDEESTYERPTYIYGDNTNITEFLAAGRILRAAPKFIFNPTKTGLYTFKVIHHVYYAEDGIQKEDTSARTERSYFLDVMPENSILLRDNTTYPVSGFTSNDYISLKLVPKASNTYYHGRGAIKITGRLYFTDIIKYGEGGEEASVSPTRAVKTINLSATNNQECSWNLGAIYQKDFGEKSEIQCKVEFEARAGDSSTENPLVILFKLVNKQPLAASYKQDDLKIFFDFSDTSTFADNAIKNKVVDGDDYRLLVKNVALDNATGVAEISSESFSIQKGDYEQYQESINALTLSGNAYAYTVKYTNGKADIANPWHMLTGSKSAGERSFTLETRIRSSNIGKLDAIALALGYSSINGLKQTGMHISYDSADIKLAENTHNDLISDVWHHICFVVNDTRQEGLTTTGGSTYSRGPCLCIYIDGVLSKVVQRSSNSFNIEPGTEKTTPLSLNGILSINSSDYTVSSVSNQGELSVQFIRMYSCALDNSEVFSNYLSSIGNTSKISAISNKNDTATAPVIYFVKNNAHRIATNGNKANAQESGNTPSQNFWTSKKLKNTTFSTLHTIKIKKSDDESVNTSKNSLVNCTMYWRDDAGDIKAGDVRYSCSPNVDVFLQGTSSLNYPVKNYQIKVYTDNGENRDKQELHPPYMEDSGVTDWNTDSYVYTLKCDYMEQSHRNNTPTACYYQDHVLPSVMQFCANSTLCNPLLQDGITKYSPARRITTTTEDGNDTVVTHPYRDAINGFPCIVYYLDLTASDDYINEEKPGFIYEGENCSLNPKNMSYAGTYMFNIDKEGDQLGFDIEVEALSNNTETCICGETGSTVYVNPQTGKFIDDSGILLQTSSDNVGMEVYPCTSYEGATNDNYSAAAFVPFSVQRNLLLHNVYDNLTTVAVNGDTVTKRACVRKLKMTTDKEPEPIVPYEYDRDEEDSEFLVDEASYYDFTSFEAFYNVVIEKDNLETIGPTKEERLFYGVLSKAEHDDYYGDNEDDYFEKTLEPRYTFAEDYAEDTVDAATAEITEQVLQKMGLAAAPEEGDEKYSDYQKALEDAKEDVYADAFYPAAYTPIKNAVNWVYTSITAIEQATGEEKETKIAQFKADFKKYFSFEYCLAYYLQMLLFTQVDNAGKNAMFDTWGDGRLYPRPYDMDSQMGLDNSGIDQKPVSSELHFDLSPVAKSGSINASNWSSAADRNHARFSAYNTNKSYMWKSFGTYFAQEIAECYAYLRTAGVYNADSIFRFVNQKTADIIGEQYYNDDAVLKYLTLADDSYYYCVNGDRKDRYYSFLNQRIIFLDSYFNYESDISLNGTIQLRANANSATSYLGLVPYSAQYCRIRVDAGDSINAFIDKSYRYLTNDKVTYADGVKITLSTNGQDKNIYISGGGNLQKVDGLDALNTTDLKIAKAVKLAVLEIANSGVQTITFGDNDMLTRLDLSGMKSLTSTIDLSQCSNLQYLDVHDSTMPALILPEHSNLEYLDCSNSAIQSLTLSNLNALENQNLKLSGCNYLTELTISNCAKLASTILAEDYDSKDLEKVAAYFPFSYLPALTKVTIANTCPNFKILELTSRSSLETLNITSPDCEKIILTDCAGSAFDNLSLTSLENLNYLDLSGVQASSNASKVILNANCELKTLHLENSNVSALYTDADTLQNNIFNFAHISGPNTDNRLENLTLSGTGKLYEVHDLYFSGDLSSLFYNCSNLTKLFNCDLSSGSTTSISNMFSESENLTDLTTCKFTFKNVESASVALLHCAKLTWPSITRVLAGLHFSTAATLDSTGLLMGACNNKNAADSVDYPLVLPATIPVGKRNENNELIRDDISGNYEIEYKPTFTANTTKAYEIVSGTGMKVLEPGLLDNLPELTDVKLFLQNSSIVYVPEDIFLKNPKLELAYGAFGCCEQLGYSNMDKFSWVTKLINFNTDCDIPVDNQELIKTSVFKTENISDGTLSAYLSEYEEAQKDGESDSDFSLRRNKLQYIHLCDPTNGASWHYDFDNAEWVADTRVRLSFPYNSTAEHLSGGATVYYPPVVLSYNTKIFNTENSALTDISSMFYQCKSLTRLDSSEHTLDEFFAGLQSLTTCATIFKECSKLDFQFNDNFTVFKDCTDLRHIDAMFEKSGLSCLPHNILSKKVDDQEFTQLKTARGLFANCYELALNWDHTVHKDFFSAATNLTHIGTSDSDRNNNPFHLKYGWTGRATCPGMFANSNIYVAPEAFDALTQLVDASSLFFVGRRANANTPIRDSERVNLDVSDNSGVRFIAYTDGAWKVTNAFCIFNTATYTNLSNVSYMFAGNQNISVIDSDAGNCLLKNAAAITNMKALFAGCKNLSTLDLKALLNNKSSVSNVASLVAECVQLNYNLSDFTFDGNTNISTCASMFQNSAVEGEVSAALFNDCRQTLQDTKYMFAGCKQITKIGCGYAIVNDPGFYDNSGISYYTDEYTDEIISKYSTVARFKSVLAPNSSVSTTDEQKLDLASRLQNWFGTAQKFDRYKNYVYELIYTTRKEAKNNTDDSKNQNIFLDEDCTDSLTGWPNPDLFNSIKTEGCSLYYQVKDVVTEITIDPELTYYFLNTRKNILQPGLLSNCTGLTGVQYMFAGCTGLRGAIPADMFYFDPTTPPATGLTSLEGLFYCCYNLSMFQYFTLAGDTLRANGLETTSGNFGVINSLSTGEDDKYWRVKMTGGGNYYKIYPCSMPAETQETVTVYQDSRGGEASQNYLVPEDWLASLTNLKSVAYMFSNIGIARYPDSVENVAEIGSQIRYSSDYKKLYETLILPNSLFANQYLITNASHLLDYCLTVGGSELDSTFLSKSFANLTDINYIFEFTLFKNVKSPFKLVDTKNSKLTNVTRALYHTSYPLASTYSARADSGHRDDKNSAFGEGTSLNDIIDNTANFIAPEFWNRSAFSAIRNNTLQGSLAPRTQWSNKNSIPEYMWLSSSGSSIGTYSFSTTWNSLNVLAVL